MITDSMNERELFSEVYRQLRDVKSHGETLVRKIRRRIMKAMAFPYNQSGYYTLPGGNRWLIMFTATRRSTCKKVSADSLTYICLHCDNKGRIWPLLPYRSQQGTLKLMRFLPHFISRETQRNILHQGRLPPLFTGETSILYDIRCFFIHNSTYFIDSQDKAGVGRLSKAGERLYISMPDGVGCGIALTSEVSQVNTFVSYEQAYKNQMTKFLFGEMECKIAMHQYLGYSLASEYRMLKLVAARNLESVKALICLCSYQFKVLPHLENAATDFLKNKVMMCIREILKTDILLVNGLSGDKGNEIRDILRLKQAMERPLSFMEYLTLLENFATRTLAYYTNKYQGQAAERKRHFHERKRREREIGGIKYNLSSTAKVRLSG